VVEDENREVDEDELELNELEVKGVVDVDDAVGIARTAGTVVEEGVGVEELEMVLGVLLLVEVVLLERATD